MQNTGTYTTSFETTYQFVLVIPFMHLFGSSVPNGLSSVTDLHLNSDILLYTATLASCVWLRGDEGWVCLLAEPLDLGSPCLLKMSGWGRSFSKPLSFLASWGIIQNTGWDPKQGQDNSIP